MRRLLTSSVALGVVMFASLASFADDKKADDKKPAAGSFAALKAEYEEAFDAFRKDANAKMTAARKEQAALQAAVKDADTDEAKKAAEEKLKAFKMPMIKMTDSPNSKYAAKFIEFATKNPNDPAVFESLTMAVRTGFGTPAMGDAVKAIKAGGYVAKPEIKGLVRTLAGLPNEDAVALVREVIKANPDRKTQVAAIKALVQASERPNSPIKDADELKKLMEDKYADLVVNLNIGKPAPEVEMKDLDGKPVKLSALKGKVVVLDIWATWCGPCVAMIPHSTEMCERLKSKPFTLVSISADEKLKTLTDFMAKKPMPWTHWWNGSTGGILEDWDVQYFPTIYVIDAKGIIRHKDLRGEKLEEAVNELLKETEKGSN